MNRRTFFATAAAGVACAALPEVEDEFPLAFTSGSLDASNFEPSGIKMVWITPSVLEHWKKFGGPVEFIDRPSQMGG